MSLHEAAESVVRVAVSNMYAAFTKILSRAGVDPRDFALVAFGGAGPLVGSLLAREVGIPTVFVPRSPGTLCALGAITADILNDAVRTVHGRLDALDLAALAGEQRALEAELLAWVDAAPRRGGARRPSGTGRTCATSASPTRSRCRSSRSGSRRTGAAGCSRRSTGRTSACSATPIPHAPVEIVNLRAQLRGVRPRVPLVEVAAGTRRRARRGARRIWLDGRPAQAQRVRAREPGPGRSRDRPGHRRAAGHHRARPGRRRRDGRPVRQSPHPDGRRDASRRPDPRAPPELPARRGGGHGLRGGAHRAHHVREGDRRLHLRPPHPGRGLLRLSGRARRGEHGRDQLRADARGGGPARARRRGHHERSLRLARRPRPTCPTCTWCARSSGRGGSWATARASSTARTSAGMVPASISPRASEIFQEGLRLPPKKLFVRGAPNRDLLDVILANCRIPEQNWGDLQALVAGLVTGERRVHALIAPLRPRHGREGRWTTSSTTPRGRSRR